jgi:RimJ/RimL family protein N-acetyltransferase
MLIGKSIILRPLKRTDINKTLVWRNDIEMIRQAQLVRFPKTEDMEQNWYDLALTDISNRNIYFGIDEIESGEFVGIIQITEIDWISGTGVWGFIIGEKENRGKGYSKEAPVLLFDYAFNFLNLRKIYGYPVDFNKATLKMHEKIGNFKEEGCLKDHVFYDGKYHDVLILSIFKEDFNNSKIINIYK